MMKSHAVPLCSIQDMNYLFVQCIHDVDVTSLLVT